MADIKFARTLIIFLLISFWIFVSPCVAGPGKIVPYVSVSQEYSDNYRFNSTNEEEEFVTTLRGGLKMVWDSERTDASLDSRLFHSFHWDNDQLDATDGSVDASVQHQMTERFSVGASADYRRDSRIDADTETTGLILDGDRERINGGLNCGFTLSELSMLQVSGSYGITETEATNLDEDDQTYSVNLAFTKNISRTFNNTTLLLNFSYLNYSSDIDTTGVSTLFANTNFTNYREYDSDVYQLYAGFSRSITELYSMYLQAGASYTDTTENSRQVLTGATSGTILTPQAESDTWGGVLLAGVNYDGLYWDFGVSVSHDVRGSSGSNGTVERSAVSLDLRHYFTDSLSAAFVASCYLNQNERTTQTDLEELTVNLSPSLRYRFWDTFSLNAVYRYTNIEDRKADTNRERNLFMITLRKEFEL